MNGDLTKTDSKIYVNELFIENTSLTNSTIFALVGNPLEVLINNSCISLGISYSLSNSSVKGFFLYSANSIYNLTIDNFTAKNNNAGSKLILFLFNFPLDISLLHIFNNQNGSLKVSNSLFYSNVVLALIYVDILYDQSFFNVNCDYNNNLNVSGSCFYFENVLIQKFSSIFISNSMSKALTPGIIFLDDTETLRKLRKNETETSNVCFIYHINFNFFVI